jgi:hypothetical protein
VLRTNVYDVSTLLRNLTGLVECCSCGIRSPILLPMDKSRIFLSDFRRVSFDHVTDRLFEGKFVRRVGDPFARHGSDALNNASWFFRELGPRILNAAQDGG